MSIRRSRLALALVLIGGLLGLLGAVAWPPTPRTNADDKAAAKEEKAEPAPADKDARKADRAAIAAHKERFRKAFESGDAKGVASCWTSGGELIADDGSATRGRAAIEKSYRELFAKKETRKAEVQGESLRFPSRDTAIEEGHFKVRVGKGEPTTSRYSALFVREGGEWLLAVVREWPAQDASLSDLEWLIGTWSARRDDTEVRTTYEWVYNKSFIRAQFTIRQKDRTLSGFKMIGVDRSSGELRSWTFESEGGFGEATWARDGKKWVLDSAGTLADGRTMASTNILTPLGPDSFTWQSVQRSVDGEELDDLPPVKVTRVKPKE
jgi:uncharacterized protein (TIGR02246 family)